MFASNLDLWQVFLAATPLEFSCRTPQLQERSSPEFFYQAYRPQKKNCQLCVSRNDSQFSAPCNAPDVMLTDCTFGVEFNREVFKETIVTEWDLVCDRKIQVT